MRVELIARVCHEANRSICEAHGDLSQESWIRSELWQQQSAIQGVQYIMDNPDTSAEDLHNEWCRAKTRDGWAYGDEKNVERKTHPCLVAYQKLPESQQAKDKVFRGIVNLLKDV